MIRFMIHTPVNLRGRMLDYIKDNLSDLEREVGDSIALYTPHDPEYAQDCSEEWLSPAIQKGIVPDVMITHAAEFASVNGRVGCRLFSGLAGRYATEHPVRGDLNVLTDSDGLFYPLFVVPLVMFYNTGRVRDTDLKHSWTDLFNEKFKVRFPDRDRPLSRAVGGYLKREFPLEFTQFERRITYEGTPQSVVRSVISGECDMAITNITFAMTAESKGAAINIPTEGYVLLPQVLVWKEPADQRLKAFADLLMREEMQHYLGEQGVWPALKDIPLGDSIAHNGRLKNWQGWEDYIAEVSEFDRVILASGGTE